MKTQWTPEQANEWYAKLGWLRGCNFIGSDCANRLDMFQKYKSEEKLATAVFDAFSVTFFPFSAFFAIRCFRYREIVFFVCRTPHFPIRSASFIPVRIIFCSLPCKRFPAYSRSLIALSFVRIVRRASFVRNFMFSLRILW